MFPKCLTTGWALGCLRLVVLDRFMVLDEFEMLGLVWFWVVPRRNWNKLFGRSSPTSGLKIGVTTDAPP